MTKMHAFVGLVLATMLQLHVANAFYLPGIAMKEYAQGDAVEVLANRLTSPSSALPYSYYSLPFCKPADPLKSKSVNLGQLLVGERAFPTPYKLNMNQEVKCAVLCQKSMASLDSKEVKRLKDRIKENYVARLNADNMPLVTRFTTKSGQPVYRFCLLYTSPSPRDQRGSRMPSSA